MFFTIVGGIGLFLLGMILLTDGLKAFAGDSLRQALLRFTGRPATAFFSGLTVTALVQSSSATTLATIGFVSAGLLSFPQAIGIVMGASLGTTSTGWIVATVGLKFSIGAFALPLTGVGAFIKLIGKGRLSSLGLALAGFGLIFLGIDTLQTGMSGLSETINLRELGVTHWTAVPLLILIGIVMTIIMQSSSAAVATTLTALYAGAIEFNQAALLVIGQAIGTTATAAIAAIGATTAAKRTALAHIMFNGVTGLVALLVLPLYLLILENVYVESPGSIALAGFHTTFILAGVLLFLPSTGLFARLIERLLPERGNRLTRHLDSSLYTMPAIALEAARNTLRTIAVEEIVFVKSLIRNQKSSDSITRQEERKRALEETRQFIGKTPFEEGSERIAQSMITLFHAIDHLVQAMHQRTPSTASRQSPDPELAAIIALTLQSLDVAESLLQGRSAHPEDDLARLQTGSTQSADQRRSLRPRILEKVSLERQNSNDTLEMLDFLRWLDSVAFHFWRISHYLELHTPRPASTAPSLND